MAAADGKEVRLDPYRIILIHLMLVSNSFLCIETVYGRTAAYEALRLRRSNTTAPLSTSFRPFRPHHHVSKCIHLFISMRLMRRSILTRCDG